jgi:acetoin utilization protein AcuB
MFIRDWMTQSVVTTQEHETVQQAGDLMAAYRIHQLPVVRGGDRLVGIVTDRDIRTAAADAAKGSQPIARIMTANPVTVGAEQPLEEAMLLLHQHRFGSLPVVAPPPTGGAGDDALPRLVGLITHTDLLAATIAMLGVEEPGSRLEVRLPDADCGQVCGALQAIGRGGARIVALALSTRPDSTRLYVRLSTIDPRQAAESLTDAGYRLLEP